MAHCNCCGDEIESGDVECWSARCGKCEDTYYCDKCFTRNSKEEDCEETGDWVYYECRCGTKIWSKND